MGHGYPCRSIVTYLDPRESGTRGWGICLWIWDREGMSQAFWEGSVLEGGMGPQLGEPLSLNLGKLLD